MQNQNIDIETKLEDDSTLVAFLKGEIDHHTAAKIRSLLDIKIESIHPKLLVLDFTQITFMDSSGIGLIKNEMKLQIPSKSLNESFVRIAVASFFAQLDPTVDEISDIKTAVSEAVTNSIVHGYENTIGTIYIHAKILDDKTIYIRIKDKGCGIENVDKAKEPMYTTCKTGERSGLGFTVMQSFMDKLKVISKIGKGTTVTLIKTLNKRF